MPKNQHASRTSRAQPMTGIRTTSNGRSQISPSHRHRRPRSRRARASARDAGGDRGAHGGRVRAAAAAGRAGRGDGRRAGEPRPYPPVGHRGAARRARLPQPAVARDRGGRRGAAGERRVVGPGWLERLLAALAADPRHGLASPSTNRAWNQLGAFPSRGGDADAIARTAAEAQQRFGAGWKTLAPLWDVGDFCLAVRREVLEAIGGADEAYDQGPCWELDFAVRAVRAGWTRGLGAGRLRLAPSVHGAARARGSAPGSRPAGAATRTSSAACCSPARAPPTSSIAAASSARTSRRCRRRPRPPPASAPLVSCIMPTSGRGRLGRSGDPLLPAPGLSEPGADHRRRQRRAELAPLPDDPRIRRERIAHGSSIGAMRNRACELARGEVIIHWDDDDWYAAQRISAQVAPDPGRPRRHHRAHRHAVLRAAHLALLAGRAAPAPAAVRAATCTAARWRSAARCGARAAATRSCRWPRTPGSCTRRWPPARG